MGFPAPGIGSGLDIQSIVDGMVQFETIRSQQRLDRRVTHNTTEFSAIGQLKSQLSTLQASLAKLSDLSNYYTKKHKTSDPSFFSTTLSPQASAGVYQIKVQHLAQQQSLASAHVADSSVSMGSGNLTINFGTYNSDNTLFTKNATSSPITLTISPDNDSLSAICDAINKAQSDATAHIVEDSQGSRIAITSSKTGLDSAMQITGDISALNYDPTTATSGLTETMAALNSSILINGLEVSQTTNQIKDAMPGVTLNLTRADVNTTATLTVEDDKDQSSNLLNDFLKQYNNSIELLTSLTGYNKEKEIGGYLQGDSQLRNLKLNLNKWVTGSLSDSSNPLKTLSDLGIKTNKDGFLEVNKERYKEVLEKNYYDIGAIFANTNSDQNTTDSKPTGGIAVLLNKFLDSYTDSKGDLTRRTELLTNEAKILSKDQARLDANTEVIKTKYLKQFNALDTLLGNLKSQSATLTQLLANLPQTNNKR